MSALEIVDFVKVQAPLYHHTTEVYAFPILDRAEAEGKFRRIIPEDKVGWDTYSYQIYKNIRSGLSGKGWYRSE